MKKKLFVLVMCVVTATSLLLSGCVGNDEDRENNLSTETAQEKTTEAKEQTTESVAEGYPERSLIAYYSFDDSTDLKKDSSGNELSLKSEGGIYEENGKVNGAVYLGGMGSMEGGSSGFRLPADVFQESGLTFACWINLQEDWGDTSTVLHATGNNKAFNIIAYNKSEQYGEYGAVFVFSNLVGNNCYTANQFGDEQANKEAAHFTIGEWAHLAFTYEENTARLYFNGELVSEYHDLYYPFTEYGRLGIWLGKDNTSLGMSVEGYMDEVYFYNYALSAEEIVELMS